MKRWFVGVLAVLGLSCSLRAQAPAPVTDTTVCDVVKKPAPFDGKMVRIKGTVVAGLDEFVIKDATDPNCGFQVNAIWLSYPQGTKGKAGPAAMVQVQPARNFQGQYSPPARTPVTLDKSKDFKQFDSLLAQTHEKGADVCLGCTRYEVTATLVGRLDAVADASLKRDAKGKIVGFGGFGNMNAYPARLVLQSVSDVTPKEIDYAKIDDATKGDPAKPLFAAGAPGPLGPPGPPSSDPYALIDTVQKIAQSMPDSSAKDQTLKAAAIYGKDKEREHNGVNIVFGVANEAAANEALGGKDSPDGVLFNCTFNVNALPGPGLGLALAHIGEHVSELRNPAPQNIGAAPIAFESDGWVVVTITAVGGGERFLTLPGAYMLWNSNWPTGSRNEQMAGAMKAFLANEMLLSQ